MTDTDADEYSYISNPCRAWVSGSKEILYTFEPGAKLFHFHLRASGFIIANALLFADDEEHVRRILRGFIEFEKAAEKKYKSQYRSSKHRRIEMALNGEFDFEYPVGDDKRIRKDKLILRIKEAPLNQMFKTGWAGNDTL